MLAKPGKWIHARLLAACLLFSAPLALEASRVTDELWDNQVAPILDRHCTKCHAGVRQKSGLDLRSLETILRGGERGPAVIPGNPEESRLIQFALPDADPHMPPEGKKQLSSAELDALRLWVAKLPKAKSPLARADSTNITWVADYLAELKRLEKPRFVPPDSMEPSKAIDAILKADWKEARVKPAELCDDSTFVRRIYLDLAGRIPTADERESFLTSAARDKRAQLVDTLLDSPDYPRRMREVFDIVLMGRPRRNNESARRENGWYGFLEYAFRTNMPWNEMVREMILARATNAPLRGANWYLYERKNNHQAMAEAVAPIAFGVQIKCAQCHNHPLAWEIEQRHYWGLVAAFNRSKNIESQAGPCVSESAIGGFVQFANLKKESQPAVLAFLTGRVVEEEPPAEKESDRPDLYLVPPAKEGEKAAGPAIPKFSRREALAQAATCDNPLLARAFVNRMWELLMGRGIVHPVDQIDSRHRAAHPVLLEWLASDFARHGCDVKRLIRSIVLSRAYQLDTSAPGRTAPLPQTFARALEKPLTAEQLFDSLLVATGNFPPAEDKNIEELRRTLVKRFPDLMPAVYNPSLEQALFWSNSPQLDALLKPCGDNTAARLLKLKSSGDRINAAFVQVLGRAPDQQESEQLQSLSAGEPAEAGVRNLLWTLVSSAEFQLNH